MKLIIEMDVPAQGRREAAVVLTLIAKDVVDSPFSGGHVSVNETPVARWSLSEGSIDWEGAPTPSGPGVPA